jgi:hypothetical protein
VRSVSAVKARSAGIEWLMQMSANLVGTVLAAGVIYVVGVAAGAFNSNQALNFLLGAVALLGAGVWLVGVLRDTTPRRPKDGGDDTA